MRIFIWAVLTWTVIESVIKVCCLAVGYLPPRNKGATAIDIVIGVGLIVWGAVLLAA